MSSFNGSSPNLDSLFLQTLMGRLQIRSPPPLTTTNPLLSRSLEDLLLDAATNYPFSDDDDDTDSENPNPNSQFGKSQLAKEEAKLERDIIKLILSGKTDPLMPNSGQAVSIGEHHICVGFHEEIGSEYRVWEWHGHIMLFDDENGYTPEYVYGNYFERLPGGVGDGVVERGKVEEKEEEKGNLGLRELIEKGDSGGNRILHRIWGAISPTQI